MSGVEAVAGLVLGGIPIIVSALEHYEEAFRILGCWRHYKVEHRRCRNRIKHVQIEIEWTLDELFLEGSGSREEAEEVRGSSNKKAHPQPEARVLDRLGPDVYSLFVDTLEGISEALEKLKGVLGVHKESVKSRLLSEKVCMRLRPVNDESRLTVIQQSISSTKCSRIQQSRSKLSYEAQRLKFGVEKERREELFTTIERSSGSLKGLLAQHERVTSLAHRQASHEMTKPSEQNLRDFWRHSSNIYRLICFAWGCLCSKSHYADLQLIHRRTADVNLTVTFRYGSQTADQTPRPWIRHRALISQVDRPLVTVPEPTPLLTASRSLRNASVLTSILSPLENGKQPVRSSRKAAGSVKFITKAVTLQLPVGTATSTVRPCGQSEEKIDNLCRSIGQHSEQLPCCGLLTNASVDGEYSVHTVAEPQDLGNEPETTTLHALLSLPRHHASALSCVERYGIALAVASSHLQLHSSEWLSSRWSSTDILFPLEQGLPRLEQLHLRRHFTPSASPQAQKTVDETFSTLGIVLLELCFGYTLDQSPYQQACMTQDGTRDLIQDRIAAQKWAEKVDGEAGPAYADAVEWCLRRWRKLKNDKGWREEFQDIVIDPIRESYEKLAGLTDLE